MARRILLAAKPKSDPKTDSAAMPPLGLLYVSRWSNADKAAEFAAIYAQSLKQRYKKAEEVAGQTPDPAHPVLTS